MSKIVSQVNNPNGVHGRIQLDVNDTNIWNKDELLEFLVTHQNHVIDIEIPEGVCLTSLGLYNLMDKFKFIAVNVRTHNLVESAPYPYKTEIHPSGYMYFNVPANADYSMYHKWSGKKIFGAFYNRPTWSRVGLASYLLANHSDQSVVNFRFNPHDVDQRKFFEVEKLFQYHPSSFKNFASVLDTLPVQLEEQDGYTLSETTQVHTNQLAQFYIDCLIDVVAETFVQGRSFYPTEKTTRPMLLKKPFIHMGPKCFLIHLRQMGFRTFHDFWEEDYDGYRPDQRYAMILQLIDSLAKKSPQELLDMYNKMQPILDHNYNLLLEKKYSKKITFTE